MCFCGYCGLHQTSLPLTLGLHRDEVEGPETVSAPIAAGLAPSGTLRNIAIAPVFLFKELLDLYHPLSHIHSLVLASLTQGSSDLGEKKNNWSS